MGLFRNILIAASLAFVLMLGACQSTPAAPASVTNGASGSGAEALADYKLGSGDRLNVRVFNEPTLSGEFVVDGSGIVSLPLVGEIYTEGMTVREFQRAYKDALEPDYLNDARLAVEVLNYRPYYILGEVQRPGEYPYSAGLTVLNAVATAGGFTYRANRKVVYVRTIDGEGEIKVELTPVTRVQPGDTIRIDERLF